MKTKDEIKQQKEILNIIDSELSIEVSGDFPKGVICNRFAAASKISSLFNKKNKGLQNKIDELENNNKWISVEDLSKIKNNSDVLIFRPNASTIERKISITKFLNNNFMGVDNSDVTHYMQLPTNPE